MHAAAALAVLDGCPRVAVRIEPRPGRLLEPVEHGLDLRIGRVVLRRPGDDAGGVLVLELQRVGDRGHLAGVAAQDLDAVAEVPGGVQFAEQVVDGGPCGSGAAGDELNVAPSRWPGAARGALGGR